MTPLDKVFWLRVGFALLAALLSGFLGFLGPGVEAYRGLPIAFIFYFASYYLVRYIMEIEAQTRKLITTGLGTYIMLFLFTWILYNTLIPH